MRKSQNILKSNHVGMDLRDDVPQSRMRKIVGMYAMLRHEKNPSWPTERFMKWCEKGDGNTHFRLFTTTMSTFRTMELFLCFQKPLTPWYEGKSAYKRKQPGPWQQCLWYQWGAFWDFWEKSNRMWCIPCFPTKIHPKFFPASLPLKNSGWKTIRLPIGFR